MPHIQCCNYYSAVATVSAFFRDIVPGRRLSVAVRACSVTISLAAFDAINKFKRSTDVGRIA